MPHKAIVKPRVHRFPTTITLTADAQQMLTILSTHQLRSRSHTLEHLVRQAYNALPDHLKSTALHKAEDTDYEDLD
jgi:hypothetical protein